MFKKTTLVIAALVFISGTALAYSVDGNLADWGVHPAAYGASQWIPNTGILSNLDDTPPGENFVDPGWGGQDFDVEAMYMTQDSSNLYFAIVTGFRPEGNDGIRAGDIAFDFGSDGSYEYGIKVVDYYGTAGSLYSVTDWELGPSNWGYGEVGHLGGPTEMTGSYNEIYHGGSNLVYNNLFYGADGHYVIEGYMPLSAFGSAWSDYFTVHWTTTCGNDFVKINVIPEPASLVLLGAGLAGLIIRRRKTLS